MPTNLPDNIQIDISGLNIGDKVIVSELLNDVYNFLHSDNTVVCQVKQSRVSLDIEDDEEEGEEGEEGAEGTEVAEGTGDAKVEGDAPAEA